MYIYIVLSGPSCPRSLAPALAMWLACLSPAFNSGNYLGYLAKNLASQFGSGRPASERHSESRKAGARKSAETEGSTR